MSNQSSLQDAVRALTDTTKDFNGDWMALFDLAGTAAGDFNGRLLAWINAELSTSYTDVNSAKHAFAVAKGFNDWNSMSSFVSDSEAPEVGEEIPEQTASGVTEDSATFAGDTADGQGIILTFSLKDGRSVATVNDNYGNTYQRVGRAVGDSDAAVEMWYAQNIQGGAAHEVTVTFDAAAYVVWGGITAIRVKGNGGFLDVQSVATATGDGSGGSATISVTSGRPKATNDLFVAAVAISGGGANAGIDTPTGWTQYALYNDYTSIMAGHGASKVQAPREAATATWTNDSVNAPYAAIIAGFRASNAVSVGVLAPVNSVLPSITGDAVVGETLTGVPGTWSNSPDSLTYQWKADGVAISGATALTYVLTEAEEGATITLTETAHNEGSGASGVSATSAGVGPVTSAGPAAVDGAHRYWRIYITSNYGAASVIEMDFYETLALGPHDTTGGTAIAGDTWFGSAANAFDGNTGTGSYWSSNSSPAWLGYDFGAGNAVKVSAIKIVGRYSDNQAPNTFDVQYSDDGSSWTTAWTVTGYGEQIQQQGSNGHLFCDPDAGYKVWVFGFPTHNGSFAVRLGELQIMDEVGGANLAGTRSGSAHTSVQVGNSERCFDGGTGSGQVWASIGFPCYIKVWFPTTFDVAQFKITASTDGDHGQAPSPIQVLWSPSGNDNFTEVYSLASQAGWSAGETRTFNI